MQILIRKLTSGVILNKTVKKPNDQMLDPDVRFLLANERTLLAWIRTSMALIAGGVVLAHINSYEGFGTVLGGVAVALGAFMNLAGYSRFKAADHAIRNGELPKTGSSPLVQIAGVVTLSVALIISEIIK
jgi:putative membrane protein